MIISLTKPAPGYAPMARDMPRTARRDMPRTARRDMPRIARRDIACGSDMSLRLVNRTGFLYAQSACGSRSEEGSSDSKQKRHTDWCAPGYSPTAKISLAGRGITEPDSAKRSASWSLVRSESRSPNKNGTPIGVLPDIRLWRKYPSRGEG